MYANGNENERPGVAEQYAGAISDGVSRTSPHKVGRVDLVAASGMSPYRMGTALMRLVSEWQSGATPQPSHAPSAKDLRKAGAAADLADAEARRLAAQTVDWHLHENKLRFQRLKTLPTVRAAVVQWIAAKEWADTDAEHLAAMVLRYYLAPKCTACGGSGVREFAGNNRRGAGKPCAACRENTVRGELNVPHGGKGKAVLQYLKQCTGQAANDMSQGTFKLRHDLKQDIERYNQKVRERTAVLQHADAEATADAARDTEADAAHFSASMDRKR